MHETTLATRNETLPVTGAPQMPGWSMQPAGGEELSLIEIWRTLFKRKIIVGAFLLGTLALVTAYILYKTPLYEGVARIEIDPNRTPKLGLQDLMEEKLSSDTSSVLQTEVKILESDSLASQVIDQLNWAVKKGFGREGTQTTMANLEPRAREKVLKKFCDKHKVRGRPNT